MSLLPDNICNVDTKQKTHITLMRTALTDYRINDEQKQFLDLYQKIADTITGEYTASVNAGMTSRGINPSFEEVMNHLKALNDELTFRAFVIKEKFRAENGRRSAKLTRGCDRIIKKSVQEYIRKVLTNVKMDKVHTAIIQSEIR